MAAEIFKILDKEIHPKAYQQTLVELLKSNKALSSDLINKVKSYYGEADRSLWFSGK